MEASTSDPSSSRTSTPIPPSAPSTSQQRQPTTLPSSSYYHIPTKLDVYTHIRPYSRVEAPVPTSDSRYKNPYVPTSLADRRTSLPTMTRSSSAGAPPPKLPVLSSSSATATTSVVTAKATKLPSTLPSSMGSYYVAPPSATSAAPQTTRTAADKKSALPSADSMMIPRDIAVKMMYADFAENEYLTRSEWGTKYPRNLDPSNGLETMRCLFCTKHYSGPNARSMWRRHVSGKHDFQLNGTKAGSRTAETSTSSAPSNENSSTKRMRQKAGKGKAAEPKLSRSRSIDHQVADDDEEDDTTPPLRDSAELDDDMALLDPALQDVSQNIPQSELDGPSLARVWRTSPASGRVSPHPELVPASPADRWYAAVDRDDHPGDLDVDGSLEMDEELGRRLVRLPPGIRVRGNSTSALLPSITLAPALRIPNTRTPFPKSSWSGSLGPTASPTPFSRRPRTPDTSSASTSNPLDSDPFAAPTSTARTLNKRTMSEAELRRALLALESPGPGGRTPSRPFGLGMNGPSPSPKFSFNRGLDESPRAPYRWTSAPLAGSSLARSGITGRRSGESSSNPHSSSPPPELDPSITSSDASSSAQSNRVYVSDNEPRIPGLSTPFRLSDRRTRIIGRDDDLPPTPVRLDEDDPFQTDIFADRMRLAPTPDAVRQHVMLMYQESPVLKKRGRDEPPSKPFEFGIGLEDARTPDLDLKNFDWDSVHAASSKLSGAIATPAPKKAGSPVPLADDEVDAVVGDLDGSPVRKKIRVSSE